MQLTTPVPIINSASPINHTSKVLSLGSCFAENIAAKLDYYKFKNNVNPFGILFHPLAIDTIIHRAINKIPYSEDDVFLHNDFWHCSDSHSDLSSPDAPALLSKLNQGLNSLYIQIAEATHVIITYGTAWVYRHKQSNAIVANCHKIPQSQFTKELLSVTSIQDAMTNTITAIKKVNANAEIIFSISPVRHLKDGFPENQRSKAHLIAAVQQSLHEQQSNKHISYFPSYEIMMDELRDYRFYAADMLHPNQIAIDFIWERFSQASIDPAALTLMEKIDDIQKALRHRPFNPASDSHLLFLSKLKEKIAALQLQYPQLANINFL